MSGGGCLSECEFVNDLKGDDDTEEVGSRGI
jgi:hypothetical protein